MGLLIALHVLAAVIWVGGMFFAYVVVRPAVTSLSLAERLPLWSRVFGRFFLFVWLSIVTLIVTGYWMIFGLYGGFESLPTHIHIMHGLGWLMFLMFGHLFFAPWRRLRRALEAGTLDEASRYLNMIRLFVAANLVIGLFVIAIAAGGRYGLI